MEWKLMRLKKVFFKPTLSTQSTQNRVASVASVV